jgi:thiol-disulfide isomerase/thioredoxin
MMLLRRAGSVGAETTKGERMRTTRFVHIVVITLIALAAGGVSVLAACGGSSSSGTSADVEFIPAGDFKVADYAGKPLVINYFGSWCGPCNLEAPALAAFAEAHPEAQFIGIAVEDQQGDVVDFMNKYGLTYPVVLDDGWDIAGEDGVSGVPTTVFYDSAGKEVDRIVGASTQAQFNLSYTKAQ